MIHRMFRWFVSWLVSRLVGGLWKTWVLSLEFDIFSIGNMSPGFTTTTGVTLQGGKEKTSLYWSNPGWKTFLSTLHESTTPMETVLQCSLDPLQADQSATWIDIAILGTSSRHKLRLMASHNVERCVHPWNFIQTYNSDFQQFTTWIGVLRSIPA